MKIQTIIFVLLAVQGLTAISSNHLSGAQVPLHDMSIQTSHFRSSSLGGWWVGFILGPLVFFCAFVCIWFNEKRAAIDSRRLELAGQICQDVDVTSEASARSKDNKLVYGSGQTRTSAVIGDPISTVSGGNLIKIIREVEVLQWRQKSRKQNDRTVYYYELQWVSSNSERESERFNNPANWFINKQIFYNQQVYLGGYNISREVADKCTKYVNFTPTLQHAQSILTATRRMDRTPNISGDYIYFSPAGSPGYGMLGSQGQGTLRVRFLGCPTGPMSLVGKSTGPTFSSFNIAQYEGTADEKNGVPDCCCCLISSCYAQLLKPIEYILEVHEQRLSRQEVFDKAIQKSECFTRTMRILSFLCIVLGIYLFFSPIVELLGYIPLVGGIISGILGFAILLAAFLIAIPLYLIFTAISWLRFHLKVGLILLGIAAAIIIVILVLNGKGGGGDSAAAANAHFLSLRKMIS